MVLRAGLPGCCSLPNLHCLPTHEIADSLHFGAPGSVSYTVRAMEHYTAGIADLTITFVRNMHRF